LDYSGFAWNAQALFAQKPTRHFQKKYRAQTLINKHDFGFFSETHALKGRDDAFWLPQGIWARWSHGTAHQAGIGIWVKDSFLKLFNKVSWIEIEPGRVGLLRLEGDFGVLDIFYVYLDTQSHSNRSNSLRLIRNAARPSHCALTILTGDFNFVELEEDRWNLSGEEYSGHNNYNKENADTFQHTMRDGLGMHEWEQPFFTCEAGGARSKLDRMYNNQHISYQLDHNCSCTALEWDLELSAHRAISFSRRTPAPKDTQDRPLQPASFKRAGWKEEVIARFQELSIQDTIATNPCRRLLLLKDAIRDRSSGGEPQGEGGDKQRTRGSPRICYGLY